MPDAKEALNPKDELPDWFASFSSAVTQSRPIIINSVKRRPGSKIPKEKRAEFKRVILEHRAYHVSPQTTQKHLDVSAQTYYRLLGEAVREQLKNEYAKSDELFHKFAEHFEKVMRDANTMWEKTKQSRYLDIYLRAIDVSFQRLQSSGFLPKIAEKMEVKEASVVVDMAALLKVMKERKERKRLLKPPTEEQDGSEPVP